MRTKTLVILTFSIFIFLTFFPQARGRRIAVTYPPDTSDLVIEEKTCEHIEVHLYNKGDNVRLQARLRADGFENVSVTFDKELLIPSGSMKEAIIKISSEGKARFSGEVHVAFEELDNDCDGETGGKVIAGSSVPIEGEFVGLEPGGQGTGENRGIFFGVFSILALILVTVYVLRRRYESKSKRLGTS